MRLTLPLVVLLALAGCGDADTFDGEPPIDAPTDTPTAETSAAPPTPAAETSAAPPTPAAAPTGPPPAGSPGTFTIRLAETDDEGAPFAEVAGFLPPVVPTDAYPTYELVDSPGYHVKVDKTTLPDDYELSDTHFIYVKRRPDGTFEKASVLRGWVGVSNTHTDGTLSGIVGGFTLTPIWGDGATTPGLTYDTLGDDKRQFATTALPVLSEPAWVQPVTLPATVEDPEVTVEVGFAQEMEDDPALYLLYQEKPDRTRAITWDLKEFVPNRRVNRKRERSDDPATPSTTAFTINAGDLNEGPTEAYLLVFAE